MKYQRSQASQTTSKKWESTSARKWKIPKQKKLNNPSLDLGRHKTVAKGREANFQLYGEPIYDPKHKVKIIMLYDRGQDISFMKKTFQSTARNLDVELKIKEVRQNLREGNRIKSYVKDAVKEYDNYNMLMLVLPDKFKALYHEIKTMTLVPGWEILTQIVLEGTLRKTKGQAVFTKLLLQMVAKRGNILWVPSYEQEMKKVLKRVMLVGIESAAIDGQTLVAGCCTTNDTFWQHGSQTTIIPAGRMDQKYQAMLEVSLKCFEIYTHKCKESPEEMIIFFNSCPADQVILLQENYSAILKERIKNAYNVDVKLTVVMINVRTSERFFDTYGSEVRNVPPGTLVSKGIVSKDYDFYLVPQQARKNATCVPIHYKVITCDSNLEEGHLQELIFSQCFNYVNWTGSIKLPGIQQYAKKCAKFNAEVMKGTKVSDDLHTRLYYI